MNEKKHDVPVFTKAALLESKKYEGMRDVLSALLEDDQGYTADEAARLVEDFLKRKV